MRMWPVILLAGIQYVTTQGSSLRGGVGVCEGVVCRAGRECVELENHQRECVCITKCPDHWKPTCGSDGISYDNHCELHRSACVGGSPVSPLHPGFCKKDRQELLAREEFIEELSHWGEERKVPLPTACFENDRNRLREFLISWFQLSSRKQSWYSQGLSYGEILAGHFTAMDKNEDNYLDSEEMFIYISRNNSNSQNGTKSDKIRQLCLDALVEEGDVNMDWRLGFTEYKEMMQEDYIPSTQVCKLNGKVYSDGAETTVECNGCVCACGKWICTSNKCTEGYTQIFTNRIPAEGVNTNSAKLGLDSDDYEDESDYDDDDEEEEEEDEEDDDEDDFDDDEDPEDDPDVRDINWF